MVKEQNRHRATTIKGVKGHSLEHLSCRTRPGVEGSNMADDIEDEDFLLSQLTAEEIAELSEIIDPDVTK